MAKKILLSILFVFSSIVSQAQFCEWARQGDPVGHSGTGAVTDKFSNVYTISRNLSDNTTLRKYDTFGNSKWAISLLKAPAYGISTDKVGNIYLAGGCGSGTFCGVSNTVVATATDNGDAFLAKIDSSGNIAWIKMWGYSYSTEAGFTLNTDTNGNCYVSGSGSKNIPYGPGNFMISKFDTQGNLIWSHDSNWNGHANPFAADIDAKGNCYITGYFYASAYFDNTILTADPGTQTIFIVKYDEDGNMLWAKKEGASYGESRGISLDGRGHFYLTGYGSNGIAFGNTTLTGLPPGGMFIVKYDTSGNVVWAKREGVSFGGGLACDTFGNIFVTGLIGNQGGTTTAQGTLGVGDNMIALNSKKETDIFVAKYDKDGNLYWGITPVSSAGGANFSNNIYVNVKADCFITGEFTGTITLGAITLSCPYTGANYESFIAKLKDSIILNVDAVKSQVIKTNEFFVYPNPTGNIFTLSYANNQSNIEIKINIIDVLGKTVYTETITAFTGNIKKEINLGSISKGTYIIRLSSQDIIETKKIMIE